MLKGKAQTHNDGVVRLYAVTNAAPPGKMPVDRLTLKRALRYKERTVGMNRHFAALRNSIRIQFLLRCPLCRDITTQDIAIPNDGCQYRVVQIQYPEDVDPPVMDLTLEAVSAEIEVMP